MSFRGEPKSVPFIRKRLATQTDTQVADSFKSCDTMDGMTVPTSNEVETLTMYTNDACDQVTVRGGNQVIPSELYTDKSVVTDIKDYFSRPRMINSFVVPAGKVLINAYVITNSFIQTNLYNFSRIKGAFGYRCTLCFRLQLAAQPFLAGRLRMAFQPFFSPTATPGLHNRFTSATALSMLPGVELDYTEQTSVVLKIPFIHPYSYFSVNKPEFGVFGSLGIFSYLPISRANSSPFPAGSVYMWAEDFEIIGASDASIAIPFPVVAFSKAEDVEAPIVSLIEAQSGKMSATAKEEKAVPGNLSKILGAGSTLAMIAGAVAPSISAIAGPASWAMREMSKTAASYGWSKPIDAAPVTKVYRSSNTNQFNSDGADNSHNLGVFSENSVQPYPGFAGTDIDEMSIKYVVQKPCLIYNGTLLATSPINTDVYLCDLCPLAMIYQSTFNRVYRPNLLAFWPSPIFAIANGFSMYRGGFKFKIKLAKTKMHTGRLLLGFQLNEPEQAVNFKVPTDALSFNFKSVVWDLREGNEIEFECPFISPLPYIPITYSFGTFFIKVLESFSGPTSVGPNCPFAIEVSAMDDFEVAGPSTFSASPAPLTLPIFAQSGSFVPFSDNNSGSVAEFCIGEKVNSIKQLLTRAALQEVVLGSVGQTYNATIALPGYDGSNITNSVSTPYQYFYHAYGLNRGSACYDFVPTTKNTTVTAFEYGNGPNAGPVNRSVVTEYDNSLHVRRPFYSLASRNINDGLTTNNRSIFAGIYSVESDPKTLFYVRMADDFQFGYFIGFPPMCYPTLSPLYESDFYQAIAVV